MAPSLRTSKELREAIEGEEETGKEEETEEGKKGPWVSSTAHFVA